MIHTDDSEQWIVAEMQRQFDAERWDLATFADLTAEVTRDDPTVASLAEVRGTRKIVRADVCQRFSPARVKGAQLDLQALRG